MALIKVDVFVRCTCGQSLNIEDVDCHPTELHITPCQCGLAQIERLEIKLTEMKLELEEAYRALKYYAWIDQVDEIEEEVT